MQVTAKQTILSTMNNAEVKQVGNLYPDTPRFKNRTAGRVYDVEGISPTIPPKYSRTNHLCNAWSQPQ